MGGAKLPQPYNNPSTYPNHSGVDYGQPMDKAIFASGNGKIIFVGWLNDRAGWSVIVSYDAGCDVLYAHQPVHPPVAVNKRVALGDYLGRIGSSGNSRGPHLHMEIMRGNGAHTYEGVWNYFDKSAYIGGGSSSGGESTDSYEEEDMYIAVVGDSWYLIQNVKGQPTGHLLGAASEASKSGLPIIRYVDKWAQDQLRKTTVLK